MAGEFLPTTKEVASRKKKICKTNLFYQNKHDHQLFLQILVKFLRNSIKDVVSRGVSGALSGALKIARLRPVTIQSTFSDDSLK